MAHGGKLLIDQLAAHGVTRIFEVPGESFLAALDGLYDAPAIRTIVCRDGVAHVQAGAGIVADSVPATEYEETQNKAAALFRAIEVAAAQEDW